MPLSRERIGEICIALETLIWSFFPIISLFALQSIAPISTLFFSTLLSLPLFVGLVLFQKKWHEIYNIKAFWWILRGTLFISISYYLLYFIALQYTSANNAALIGLTQTFFNVLYFHIWKKDHIPVIHIVGSLCTVIGTGILLFPKEYVFSFGDILLLCANSLLPYGNYCQAEARKYIGSSTMMLVRNTLTVVILCIPMFLIEGVPSLNILHNSMWYLLINGVIMLGISKILWIEAIHRISITKTAALSGVGPLFTVFFSYILFNEMPDENIFWAFVPLFLGVILLTGRVSARK